MDASTDAGRSDAGPPPESGPFADLVIAGRVTGSYRLIPPANTVVCRTEGTDNGYIGLSVHPDGVGTDGLEIDIFGPVVVGSYPARTGMGRRMQFGMLYHAAPPTTYLVDTETTPCTFEVTSLSGGVLEAIFDCRGLVNLAAPGAMVDVSGRVRCDYP